MYSASRITPVQRMRRQSSCSPSTRAVSPSKQKTSARRGSSLSTASASSTKLGLVKTNNGDYQVLRNTVDKDREAVRDARMVLATSLDQLGEHHVRQKEYDDAMDAFTEALREKRSVFWHMSHRLSNGCTVHSRGSSLNCSFLSGSTASTSSGGSGGGDEDESTTFSNKDPAGQDVFHKIHDNAIDELANTLKSLGNVHSLRGEQDEAMRYFTEVTSLRAQKKGNMAQVTSDAQSADNRSFLSGLNDENSALMSEINEDVKALDDLFRSISFRSNGPNNSGMGGSPDAIQFGSSEKRKSKSGTVLSNNKKHKTNYLFSDQHQQRLQQAKSSLQNTNIVENEPFDRASTGVSAFASFSAFSNASTNTTSEAVEAMEMYKSAIEVYVGPASCIDQHKEMLNSLALRVDLLNENHKKASGESSIFQSSSGTAGTKSLYSNPESVTQTMSCKAADLELSLEIYQYVLVAHQESRSSLLSSISSEASHHSIASNDSSSSATSKSTPSTEITGNLNAQLINLQQPTSPIKDPDQEFQQQQVASNIASTLICMGSIYYKLGNRVEELRMYQEAKRVYRKVFGENHEFVAGTRKNIGMVLAERGEYDEAMKEFEKAMRIYLAVNSKTDSQYARHNTNPGSTAAIESNMLNRDVASAISCMGNVKNRIGELDAALFKYMQALQIYKLLYHRALTEPNAACAPATTEALRDVTSTLKVVGMVHAKKGDLDTAMSFFQEAMSLLRSMESSSSADFSGSSTSPNELITSSIPEAAEMVVRETTASVLTRIASIHLKKGDLDAAMSHYREAYNLTIRNRGTTNHAEVAGILHYIGGIYHKRADYDEAMSCYQESIRVYHATLGPGNPTVAGTLVMVGSIHYKRRLLDSAMMFYREALRLNRDAYGMHHPDVAPILKSIGTILTKKGEYEEAYDIFRDVLSIKCTVHGTDHPEVASAYKSLGNVHYKLGDLADAERQYRHALSIYRRCKGEDHPDTIAAKTTIEHLRYWMRERDQRRHLEQRQSQQSFIRQGGNSLVAGAMESDDMNDERSC